MGHHWSFSPSLIRKNFLEGANRSVLDEPAPGISVLPAHGRVYSIVAYRFPEPL